jgi:O-antigen/teichoic acid export membrane protein
MIWVMSVGDRYIIQMLPHGAEDVGIYSAGYGLVSQPFLMLSGVLAAAFRPVWYSAVATGNPTEARRHYSRWLLLATLGAAIGVTLAWLLAPWAVGVFLGPRYKAAEAVVPWIAAGYFFYCLQQVMEGHLMARKHARAVLVASAVAALLSVALTIPMVLHFGYKGAAYACPLYFAAHWAVTGLVVAMTRSTPWAA